MKSEKNLDPEEVRRSLADLRKGKLAAGDIERRYGISVDELRRWQIERGRAVAPYRPDRVGRSTDLLLVVALLLGAAIVAAARFLDAPLKDRIIPILLALIAISVLGLVYQDIRRGMVRFGTWIRFYREQEPFAFWTVIVLESLLISAFALIMLARGLGAVG